ncbi:MAG TPA: helix-turn-helix domain-containing protein [Solirubrobacteraceae bacterium]|nr:helix-turn-helix domain-containing protein [Solirubrobacteraceae bacterium]
MRLPILRELDALRERHDVEVRRMVAKAVAAGARTQDIADALGMSRSTLWRRYGDELRRGSPPVRAAEARPDQVAGG